MSENFDPHVPPFKGSPGKKCSVFKVIRTDTDRSATYDFLL